MPIRFPEENMQNIQKARTGNRYGPLQCGVYASQVCQTSPSSFFHVKRFPSSVM